MCNNQLIIKKWLKVAIIVLTVGLIAKVSYDQKWLDVASGICKLESNHNKKVRRISLKALSFIALVNQEEAFLAEMSSMGWTYIKHYGRGMIFEKEGYEILITKREYFNRYAFYEVTTREIFDVI